MTSLVSPKQPVLHSGTAPMWLTVDAPYSEAQMAAIHLLPYALRLLQSQHMQRQEALNINCSPALHHSHQQTRAVVQVAGQQILFAHCNVMLPTNEAHKVLCCAVLCCAVLRCAALCCAVLCCAVLCCILLCCKQLSDLLSLATGSNINTPWLCAKRATDRLWGQHDPCCSPAVHAAEGRAQAREQDCSHYSAHASCHAL